MDREPCHISLCASHLWNDKMARICNKASSGHRPDGRQCQLSYVNSDLIFCLSFFPTLLTTRASSLSLSFLCLCAFLSLPHCLSVLPFLYLQAIQFLYRGVGGWGEVVPAVQRERKKIMIEKWFKLHISKDSKVSKSHTSKGVCAVNHLRQSPIIQQKWTVTQVLERDCMSSRSNIYKTFLKIWNIERNSEGKQGGVAGITISAKHKKTQNTQTWLHTDIQYAQECAHTQTHHGSTLIQAARDPGKPSGLEQEESQSFPLEDITVKHWNENYLLYTDYQPTSRYNSITN